MKADAVTIYPFVFFASKTPSNDLQRHEWIHVLQIREKGLTSFYLDYFRQYLLLRLKGKSHAVAYHGITYEQEAYARQNDTRIAVGFNDTSDTYPT